MEPDPRRIRELFEAALDLPVGERGEFIVRACGGDTEARRRVEALLAAADRADLLDRPVHEAANSRKSAPNADEARDLSGQMIGVYRLIRELGKGGMGLVYLAQDTKLGRRAAVKLLPTLFTNHPDRVRRLQREARSASALNHPNIITIYDFGRENGHDYIASEFVEGRTLRDFVGDPDLTLTEILDVAIQVASALEAAHAAGIVHRDIKPENVMVRPDGYVKVLDFGLAKLTEGESGPFGLGTGAGQGSHFETQADTVLGTVNYMSPEQARGQTVDRRSDLFSLGVVLYELATGARPFAGETWHHTIVAITDSEPPPLARYLKSVPVLLQSVVSRALAKDRDQRYQTARELVIDLQRLQAEVSANFVVARIDEKPASPPHIEDWRTAGGDVPPALGDAVVVDKPRVVARFGSPRRRQFVVALALFVLITAATYLYFGPGGSPSPPVLTGKDTILLADFVNTTGDTDFDDTLKRGLAVQLGQSPYLNIYPEERVAETLKLMGRPPQAMITREIGREICQRRGIKLLLVGAISRLGRNYVITLEAVNSQSGEGVAYQQAESESKEKVLGALGGISTEMRGKLGESLASIRKFDVPIEQATTASLEAFKDFTVGLAFWSKGHYAESIPALKRAVELDPEFALAYVQIGVSYRDLRNLALGDRYLERAYQLRDRVSERERLEIAATFFRHITGELDKRIEATSLLTETYPQATLGFHLHGNSLMVAGEYERAAQAYNTALRLDADNSLSRANLALALIGLNRFDEAQAIIEQGRERGLDSSGFHNRLYLLAFLRNDALAMRRESEWFSGRPDEYQIREIQARSLAFAGRRREAVQAMAQAAAMAEERGLLAEKARIVAGAANLEALFGMKDLARKDLAPVLTLLEKKRVTSKELLPSLIQQLDSPPAAWTLALCGDATRARRLVAELTREFPSDTIQRCVSLPLVRATLELNRGATESVDVVQLLQLARPYEAAASFRPNWVRAEAYLRANDGDLAAQEFQQILEHRGWDVLSPLWPLAHLGLARAAALQGDAPGARKAFNDFFTLWKDADSDLPVLKAAKKEYDRMERKLPRLEPSKVVKPAA